MAYRDLKAKATLAICLAMCLNMSMASIQFRVGGPRGWFKPTGRETETYNQWAERNRFQINDNLYFRYNASEDSVLLVTNEAYNTCNISNPIASYDDGNTVFKFQHSGPFFFVSGAPGHCAQGQKLIVVVLGPPSAHNAASPSPSHMSMNDTNAAFTGFSLSHGLVSATTIVALGLLMVF